MATKQKQWMGTLSQLSIRQVRQVTNVVVEASLIYETGGNYRKVFERAANRSIKGRSKTMYEDLSCMSSGDMEIIVDMLIEPELHADELDGSVEELVDTANNKKEIQHASSNT